MIFINANEEISLNIVKGSMNSIQTFLSFKSKFIEVIKKNSLLFLLYFFYIHLSKKIYYSICLQERKNEV